MLDGFSTKSRHTGPRGVPSASNGFSLMELLLVMTIIIVVFTLYFSTGSRGFQTKQLAVCQRNLETIYVAMTTYASDNHDAFPSLLNAQTSELPLSQLIPRYTTGSDLFICPGSKDKKLSDATPFADRKISYVYYMGHTVKDTKEQPLLSDRQVNTNDKPAGKLLFSLDGRKPGNNHNRYGGNVMFCDGTVQTSSPLAAFTVTNSPGITILNPKP